MLFHLSTSSEENHHFHSVVIGLHYYSSSLAVNDSLSSTSFNNASTSDGGKSAKQEVGVAEAWTNQRKRREVSERGNHYIIITSSLNKNSNKVCESLSLQRQLSWHVSTICAIRGPTLSLTLSLTSGAASPNTGSSSPTATPEVRVHLLRGCLRYSLSPSTVQSDCRERI